VFGRCKSVGMPREDEIVSNGYGRVDIERGWI